MTNALRGVPDNSAVIIPRLVCRDPAAAVEFIVTVFEAVSLNERPGPDGTLAHALLSIGTGMLMVEREWPTLPSRAPSNDDSSPVVVFVYVPDVDAAVERAVGRGGRVIVPLQNQFWGDRTAWIADPAGHVWTVASRIEETSADERTARWSTIIERDAKAK
jgi:PhnB protein